MFKLSLQLSRLLPGLLLLLVLTSGCGQSVDTPAVMLERARIMMSRNQAEEAIPLLNEVIKMNPEDAEAFYQRGVAHEAVDVLEKALSDYNSCLRIDSERTEALNNKAVVLARMQRFEEAVAEFTRLVDLDPEGPLAYRNRGLCYTDLMQFDKALVDYSRAIEVAPEDPAGWFQRGAVYLKQSRYEEAENNFTKAIELDAELAAAWMNRGIARYRRGDKAQAATDLQKAQALDNSIVLPDIGYFADLTWQDSLAIAKQELTSRGYSEIALISEFPTFQCATFSATHSGSSKTIFICCLSSETDSLVLPAPQVAAAEQSNLDGAAQGQSTSGEAALLVLLRPQSGGAATSVLRFEENWTPDELVSAPILLRYAPLTQSPSP